MYRKKRIAIFIPARMGSTRLPGKPLADINGRPMILHVLDRAKESGIEDIYVACAEKETAIIVEAGGGKAILTDPEHPSGTDRIFEALTKSGIDYDYIVNVQGDLPTPDHKIINAAIDAILEFPDADIVTLASIVSNDLEKTNPNVVKAIISMRTDTIGKALYFTRTTAPHGDGPILHHIGLYVYRKDALEKFVKLPPSQLEKREKLEQLRALENDMNIYVVLVDTAPLGVDTLEDLEKAREILTNKTYGTTKPGKDIK
jgi:3-deoxy-manno-octulosonate cytidylyltransferase (CMP-KDO synthetase)